MPPVLTLIFLACTSRTTLKKNLPVLIDEFSAGGFTVRAYEYSENTISDWKTIYAFPVYEDENDPLRVIVLEWHNLFDIMQGYFLEESFESGEHVTYEIFEQKPSYEELKQKVIDIMED